MTAFKVLRFLDGVSPDDLAAGWSRALAAGAGAGGPGGPERVAVAAPLAEPDFAPPRFGAVDIRWVATVDDALTNEDWLAAVEPDLRLGSPSLGIGSCQVVVTEHVIRGAEALGHLWDAAGEQLVMMSFAKRRPGLTLPQFLEQWRSEAGSLGRDSIPDDVRGLAYVQNHPLVLHGHEWPFDAVNEVYLAHVEQLRRRRAWFAARQDAAVRTPAGIFDPGTTGSLFLQVLPVPH